MPSQSLLLDHDSHRTAEVRAVVMLEGHRSGREGPVFYRISSLCHFLPHLDTFLNMFIF